MGHKSQYINNFHQFRHSRPTSEDCSILPQIPQGCPLAVESTLLSFWSSSRERRAWHWGVQHRMPPLWKLWVLYLSHETHLTGLAQNNYFQILLGSTKSCLSLSQDRDLGPHLWRHFPAWNLCLEFQSPPTTFLASTTNYSGLFLLIPFLVSTLKCKL